MFTEGFIDLDRGIIGGVSYCLKSFKFHIFMKLHLS